MSAAISAASAVVGVLLGVVILRGVRALRARWLLARERAARPDVDLGDGVWSMGLHELHCREDRCVYGCDCPCHWAAVRPQ